MTTSKHTELKGSGDQKPVSDDSVLKVAKEVVVKFIEVGRLSPSNFEDNFRLIYKTIKDTVRS